MSDTPAPPPLPWSQPAVVSRNRLAWIFLAIPVVLTILLVVAGGWWINSLGVEPEDAAMIRNFQAHRPEFELLRAMIANDKGLQRVDQNWTSPEDLSTIGITEKRIAQYRSLFRKLGVPRGFKAYRGPEEIDLLAYSFGMLDSGVGKSYSWLAHPPETTVPSLDRPPDQPREGHHDAYRLIEGHWYLHYES